MNNIKYCAISINKMSQNVNDTFETENEVEGKSESK
jgi:hypothetical protein